MVQHLLSKGLSTLWSLQWYDFHGNAMKFAVLSKSERGARGKKTEIGEYVSVIGGKPQVEVCDDKKCTASIKIENQNRSDNNQYQYLPWKWKKLS